MLREQNRAYALRGLNVHEPGVFRGRLRYPDLEVVVGDVHGVVQLHQLLALVLRRGAQEASLEAGVQPQPHGRLGVEAAVVCQPAHEVGEVHDWDLELAAEHLHDHYEIQPDHVVDCVRHRLSRHARMDIGVHELHGSLLCGVQLGPSRSPSLNARLRRSDEVGEPHCPVFARVSERLLAYCKTQPLTLFWTSASSGRAALALTWLGPGATWTATAVF